MAAIRKWYFLDSGLLSGPENMALDEALFRSYREGTLLYPIFRIYGWNPPAFSLGYSQNPTEEFFLERFPDLCFVRRITGGGIIYHENELTYSIAAKIEDFGIFSSVKESYKYICAFLVAFYKRLGLHPAFACETKAQERFGEFSPFCFSKKEAYDITIGGKKIGGNAQRRKKNFLLQHGSIPLSIHREAIKEVLRSGSIDLTGCVSLDELFGKRLEYQQTKYFLKQAFQETFGIEFFELDPTVVRPFWTEILEQKYLSREWNYRLASVSFTHG